MTTYIPNSATVHNHFSKRSFTFPNQFKPQVLPPKNSESTESVSSGNPTDSVIDVQLPADKAAGSSVSSF